MTVAKQKADAARQHIVEGWEDRLAGDTSDAEKRFEAAKNLAAVRGFRYLPAPRVTELPREGLLARIEAVPERKNGELDMRETSALMGGVGEPTITVTRALELYLGLVADKTLGKGPDQLRRWENPRKQAGRPVCDGNSPAHSSSNTSQSIRVASFTSSWRMSIISTSRVRSRSSCSGRGVLGFMTRLKIAGL